MSSKRCQILTLLLDGLPHSIEELQAIHVNAHTDIRKIRATGLQVLRWKSTYCIPEYAIPEAKTLLKEWLNAKVGRPKRKGK